jgi:hypothetical protein
MGRYEFVTTWRVEAPIDRVYDAIEDSLAWPSWWDAVLAVEQLTPGDDAGAGDTRRYTFQGRLPYLLRFDMTTDRIERPTYLSGDAVGELEGKGIWQLRSEGLATLVRYDWQIRTNRWWMNILAPLPFVREIFVLNHDFVMRRGLIGLRRHLGVAASEIPDDALPAPA